MSNFNNDEVCFPIGDNEFLIAEWEIQLLEKYNYDHILYGSFNLEEVTKIYREVFSLKKVWGDFFSSLEKSNYTDIDLLLMLLDRYVFDHDGPWFYSLKLMMGEDLANVFKELEDWPTKLSPKVYGEWSESEKSCLRAVSEGRKAIYHRDCFSDEESTSLIDHIAELNSDLEIIWEENEHKGISYTSYYIVRRGNKRYADLLRWAFNKKASLSSETYHWLAGIIFGYTEDDIEEFLFRS